MTSFKNALPLSAKPRKQHTAGPMDNDRRAARYLSQTGRTRLTAPQLRQMRRMARRQVVPQ